MCTDPLDHNKVYLKKLVSVAKSENKSDDLLLKVIEYNPFTRSSFFCKFYE
jgi:hypothetical protein